MRQLLHFVRGRGRGRTVRAVIQGYVFALRRWYVTLPEFRRHHLAAALRAYCDRVLAERGDREYVSSVGDDNLPARSYAYGGPRRLVGRVARLTYVCLLGPPRFRR